MEILFTQEALADIEYWKKSGNAGAIKGRQGYCHGLTISLLMRIVAKLFIF